MKVRVKVISGQRVTETVTESDGDSNRVTETVTESDGGSSRE